MTEPDLVLDSDVLIEILRGRPDAGRWLNSLGSQTVGILVLTRMKILQGARNRQEQTTLIAQLNRYELVLLDTGDAIQALRWFETYRLSHGVGIMDCLIAASALRIGKPFYTFNVKHYRAFSAPWRMVDYLGRIAERELDLQTLAQLPLCSTVLYIGEGAGRHDTGEYRIGCLDGGLTLAWRYRVIRLWQMPAEELLTMNRPALLTLLGQTHIAQPARVVPQAIETLAQVADVNQRSRLFGLLVSLIRDEEVMAMAERLIARIERDPWLNTPFLRRLRTEGRSEGLTAAILDTVSIRLSPSAPTYRRLETQVAGLTDPARLRELLGVALRATDIAEFEAALAGCGVSPERAATR